MNGCHFSPDWSENFVQNLLGIAPDDENLTIAAKLVRRHEKNLSQNGDFSCPGDLKLWKQVVKTTTLNNVSEDQQEEDAADYLKIRAEKLAAENPDFMIRKVARNRNGYLTGFFDRTAVMTSYFKGYLSNITNVLL